MSLSNQQLHQLARQGALNRVGELEAEIAAIEKAFKPKAKARKRAGLRRKTRKRGKISAAGRRAIAAAQRKRWALLKAKKAATPGATPKRRAGKKK